jgi:hypothetical protein
MIGTAIALVACLVYVLVSLAVGDFYPFSRYSMYARLTTRTEGAVLYVKAGEAFVAPDDLDAVCGLDVDAIDPRGVPTSQEWVSHEAMRWLRSRSVGAIEGGVPIEIGYRMLKVDERGQLHERLAPRTRGTARLRR